MERPNASSRVTTGTALWYSTGTDPLPIRSRLDTRSGGQTGTPSAYFSTDQALSAKEIVEDARHALLSPPGNAPALGRSIILLASDPALRARLSAAARERVRQFTADTMVEQTETVYHSVLGAR